MSHCTQALASLGSQVVVPFLEVLRGEFQKKDLVLHCLQKVLCLSVESHVKAVQL